MSESNNDTASGRLDVLRGRLDEIDRRLLGAVAERLDIVQKIQAAKSDSNRGVFDRTRERTVYERAELNAKALGLDPKVARDVMSVVVNAAHDLQQERFLASSTSRHLAIVGGAGQMGRLFQGAFEQRGHRVSIIDVEDDLHTDPRISEAEIVIISVPMHVACEVTEIVAPRVRPDGLVLDFNSLKSDICAILRDKAAGEALGTHPMFGPTVESLRRQKVVLCPLKPGPLTEWFSSELAQMGFELIQSDPETHDRMMAAIQVLVHFRTLVMGEALRRTALSLEDTLRFTSPIYRLELAIVGRLFGQDPNLYAEIEMKNPYGSEVRQHFLQAAEWMSNIIEGGDRSQFRRAFESVGAYFSDFSDEAMTLSDYLIEALVSRP